MVQLRGKGRFQLVSPSGANGIAEKESRRLAKVLPHKHVNTELVSSPVIATVQSEFPAQKAVFFRLPLSTRDFHRQFIIPTDSAAERRLTTRQPFRVQELTGPMPMLSVLNHAHEGSEIFDDPERNVQLMLLKPFVEASTERKTDFERQLRYHTGLEQSRSVETHSSSAFFASNWRSISFSSAVLLGMSCGHLPVHIFCPTRDRRSCTAEGYTHNLAGNISAQNRYTSQAIRRTKLNFYSRQMSNLSRSLIIILQSIIFSSSLHFSISAGEGGKNQWLLSDEGR